MRVVRKVHFVRDFVKVFVEVSDTVTVTFIWTLLVIHSSGFQTFVKHEVCLTVHLPREIK